MQQVVIVIPVYKRFLDDFEQYSLDRSLFSLSGKKGDIFFIAPPSLNHDYYSERYPDIPFILFNENYFESIAGYNRLLLSSMFYQRFDDYEFLLILQPDAIILHDDLDFWCGAPFDYVGAPWPDGYELFVNAGRFEGNNGKRVKVHVGNGGLSLRRVKKCLSLLAEFEEAKQVFELTGSSEDLFFSVMGVLSGDFVIPNEITASRFSLELQPSYYFSINGGKLPMGGHAWWKYEIEFWRNLLDEHHHQFFLNHNNS
jgi:hypothetical protein